MTKAAPRPTVVDVATDGASLARASHPQRDRIRLAAVQLFTRQSYAGTSMKQLAAELGMTPANLYNYYANKEAILFEVLSHELLSLLDRDRVIVQEFEDPVERMRELAYDLVIEDLRNPLAAFVGRHGVNGLTEDGRSQIADLMAQVRAIWAATVEEGVELGGFDVSDVRASTLSVLTLCSSTTSWYSSSGDMSAEDVAAHTAEAVLRIVGSSTDTRKRSRRRQLRAPSRVS